MLAQLTSLIDPVEMFKALGNLSPVGIIGLLAYIIYQLVNAKKSTEVVADNLASVKDNHLHDLPEMLEILRSMQASLIRMESTLSAINNRSIYIATKIKNGGGLDD